MAEEDGEWEEGGGGGGKRPQRRATRNLAKNVYSVDANEEVEYAVDSPASTGTSSAKDTPPAELVRSSSSRKKVGGTEKRGTVSKRGSAGGRGGRVKGKRKGGGMKVPPMKIKLIGRTGASDSPIFFAESLGEVWTHTHTHTHTHTLLTISLSLSHSTHTNTHTIAVG